MRIWRCNLLIVPIVGLAGLVTACGEDSGSAACERNSQCPIGFACQAGVCLVSCEEDIDCNPGEICTSAVCRPGTRDAGDGSDAGTDAPGDIPVSEPIGIGPDGQPMFGAQVGDSCEATEDCRNGLSCESSVCVPAGDTPAGEPCVVSGECADGLSCSVEARCAPSADLEVGAACNPITPNVCGAGLRCQVVGLGGVCIPEGLGDLGVACEEHGDCLSPLLCSAEGACTIPIFGGLNLFSGGECGPETESPYRVYFEVPEEGTPLSEFYRLPYPNDIRLTADGIDMSGHIAPELNVLGGDLIQQFIDAVADGPAGFSPAPTIIFRFSEDFDFSTVSVAGDEPTVRYLNIDDPDGSRYGRGPLSISWSLLNGRTNYICHQHIAIRGTWHQPLAHGETYVVYLTTGVTSSDGQEPVQDDDLAAVLAAERPSDARLAQAWDRYAKFRDYLERETIDPGTIAAAAVFTTMDPDAEIAGIREGIRARVVTPSLQELALCGDEESPCEDRACLNLDEGYYELHGIYRAPIYQEGTRPYLNPGDGGAFAFDENGRPVSQGNEDMCLLMTIPMATMPESGWPVLLYAHGTGGSSLSPLNDGTAANVANIDLGDETVRFATLSIDGVQHGPRRGNSDVDPEILFFNFTNPDTWIGNVYQGAADYFLLTHLLEVIDLDNESSPTGEAIQFDVDNIFFYGHSQGATVGTPFVAYEPNLRGAVFSGAGAALTLSLLNKENPVNIAEAVQFVLNDGQIRESHPVLSLLQQAVDPVDPLHYGRLFAREVPDGRTPTHLFVSYGLGDTYSPDRTIEVFGSQSWVEMAEPTLLEVGAIPRTGYPVTANRTVDAVPVTATMVVYQPDDGVDGHFVMFRNDEAVQQSMEFLGTAVRDGVPTVSAVE